MKVYFYPYYGIVTINFGTPTMLIARHILYDK